MRKVCVGFILVVGLFHQSCAEVPKEAVELSVTVGQDLAEVHRAHRELAVRYFRRAKDDINRFTDQVYKPYAIKKAMEDFELLDKITPSSDPETDPLLVLDVFVTGITDEIEDFRREMLVPVETREEEILRLIDDTYQRLYRAQEVVTGHLASVRKVQELQDDLLDRSGILKLRNEIRDKAIDFSDDVAELVDKGQKIEGDLQEVEGLIDNFRTTVTGSSEDDTGPSVDG